MKKISTLTLILFMVLALSFNAEAQKKPKKKKNSVDFMENVWYGANLGLGLGGNNYETFFALEFSPMAGYKLTERLSAGPRIIFEYGHMRLRYTTGIQKLNLFSYGGGALIRFKVLEQLFLHGEGNIVRDQYITTSLTKESLVRPHVLLGIGYNAGGGEIMILYDFLHPNDELMLPFEIRVGYTINF